MTDLTPISDEEAKDWNGLMPLEPNAVEKAQINELLRHNPRLDYLMALILVKSTDEDLKELINSKTDSRPQPMTSTIIKDAFYFDNEGL